MTRRAIVTGNLISTPEATASNLMEHMPEWSDTALILSARPHGESAAVVSVLSSQRGRQAGLVRGGQSRSMRVCCNPAIWSASPGGQDLKNISAP